MPLVLYNTLTKTEEECVPMKKGKVAMYTCGPTVYSRPHIGNYASFLCADLLRRWLEVSGMKVKHVKNITDVGHMVADSDSGEDKVEKEARRIAKERGGDESNITADDVLKVSEMYTEQYLEDEKALHLLEPHHRPRATETIPEMITTIELLIEKGHAYETHDGIYFAVESFTQYGNLSGNTIADLSAGKRVDVDEGKKHPADFALWKKCVGDNVDHILRWDSPWGEGFPGWHIECSAMSTKFLGPTLDIHTGGEDNIFPHHECEIAQSECGSGQSPFVRLWIHRRRIDMGTEKMSKSLGNVLHLSDIVEKGFSPLDVRYLFLSVHYRTHLAFSWKGMEDAKKARRKVIEWMSAVLRGEFSGGTENVSLVTDAEKNFRDAMNADLNVSKALAALFDLLSATYRDAPFGEETCTALTAFSNMVQQTFGCFDMEASSIPKDIQTLVDERETARRGGDFSASDRIRDEIALKGYEVRDTESGPNIRPM